MRENRDQGVQGLRKVKIDLSNLRKMRGGVWVRAERGFSLIELIGVMAVMGILAAVTVPPIIRQIQQARTVNEDFNLEEVARAIVGGVQATGVIPNPNFQPFASGGWADVAYRYTTLGNDFYGPGSLHYVFPAESNYSATARRVYLDPAWMAYLDSVFSNVNSSFSTPSSGWPQTTVGNVAFPNQAFKLYIVSSSRPDFVLGCSANGAGVQTSANGYGNPGGAPLINQLAAWIKAVDPLTGFIKAPGAAVENWPDNGHQFLHVKIVDLQPLFCRVELEDLRSPATANITNPGTGYSGPFTSNDNGLTLSFTVAGGSLNSVSIVSTPGKNLWANLGGAIPIADGGGNGGIIQLTFPGVPNYGVGTSSSPMPSQTVVFYVLKGTSINLSGTSFVVKTDVKYQFTNATWRQLY